MWTKNKKAISEVNTILKQLEKSSYSKIPKKLLDEIEKNATVDVSYIKPEIALEDLDLEEETKEMLAVISYQYFCTEDERKSWQKELEENEKKYQEELNEKYNPENLFKKEELLQEQNLENIQVTSQNSLIEYKEPFFKKLWNWMKNFWDRSK